VDVHAVSFPRLQKRAAVVPVANLPVAPADPVLARLLEAVPQWANLRVKRCNGTQHGVLEILTFVGTSYCPLKGGNHSSPGSAYVLLAADGTLIFKCHKTACAQRNSSIAGDVYKSASEGSILTRYNTGWVRLEGSTVARLPILLANGQLTPVKLYSHTDFINEHKRLTEKVGKVFYPQFWLWHEQARSCPLGLIYDPSQSSDPRYLNTYTGAPPAVVAAARNMQHLSLVQLIAKFPTWFRVLRYNLCADDPDAIWYVLCWNALMIQHPELKPGVAIVMKGDKGCGKGMCSRMLLSLVGAGNGVQIIGRDLQSGFNAHYAERVFIVVDESSQTSDLLVTSAIKALITEPTFILHGKYLDQRTVDSHAHFWFNTNYNDGVTVEHKERRYAIFPATHALAEAQTAESRAIFTKLAAEVKSVEAQGALYEFLLRLDTTGFAPEVVPLSRATWQMHFASFKPHERFVYYLLTSGNMMHRAFEPEATLGNQVAALQGVAVAAQIANCNVPLSELGYRVFDRPMRYPSAMLVMGMQQYCGEKSGQDSGAALWQFLLELLPAPRWDKRQVRAGNQRVTAFVFPPQDELRTAFINARGSLCDKIWNEWKITL
jgi:hypothetical protein